MNIDTSALFDSLIPARWDKICMLPPIQRAKYFCIPGELSCESLELAKKLVGTVVKGGTKPSVRGKYSHGDDKKANAFNLSADFYAAAMNSIRQYFQSQNPSVMKLWPNVSYFTFKQCHPVCDVLTDKVLARNSAILRTFYPPWHFGCKGWVKSSHDKITSDFVLPDVNARIGYFCNPLDIAVAHNLLPDYSGLDQITHNSKAIDLAIIRI